MFQVDQKHLRLDTINHTLSMCVLICQPFDSKVCYMFGYPYILYIMVCSVTRTVFYIGGREGFRDKSLQCLKGKYYIWNVSEE